MKELMNTLRKISIVILTAASMLAGINAFGQQDALFSQYMFNQLILNPAYTGSRDVMTTTLVHRNQWNSIEGAPKTSTLSIHSPLRNENVALGLSIHNDQLGPLKNIGVMANYAYRIRMNNGRLAFGVQGGFIQQNVDLNMLIVKDQFDVGLYDVPSARFTPDFNFGVYYTARNWYVGAASKHLFESLFVKENVISDSPYALLARHFYGTAGFVVKFSDDFVVKPSTVVRFTQNAPVSIDLNANVFFREDFMLGASYRTGRNAIVLLAEVTIKENLRLGYSYDILTSEFAQYAVGSHEFMLSWDLDIYKRYQKSRRYF